MKVNSEGNHQQVIYPCSNDYKAIHYNQHNLCSRYHTLFIISIHNKNKNNGDIERNYFDQEETSTYKSIQKENTNISYTHEATTIKPGSILDLSVELSFL